MKYTLHIAFDEVIGGIILNVSEYIGKFGRSVKDNVQPLMFIFDDDKISVKRPEKRSNVGDAILIAAELKTGIPLQWVTHNKATILEGNDDIEDFFETEYSTNIIQSRGVDPELHILFYVPLYDKENTAQKIERLTSCLPKGHKFVINIVTLTYDVMKTCRLIKDRYSYEEHRRIETDNIHRLVKYVEEQSPLTRIYFFQNFSKEGWSLNFTKNKLITTCSELSLALIEHYETVCHYSFLRRPLYVLNVETSVIDIYLAVNTMVRNLFAKEFETDIVNTETLDRNKVHYIYRNILKKEYDIINKYVGTITNKANLDNLTSLFDENVKRQLFDEVDRIINNENLNVTERQYLFSLFRQIEPDTDFESDTIDDLFWEAEERRIGELEIGKDSSLRDSLHQLKELAKKISDIKGNILKRERQIAELEELVSEDYPFDGERTKDGFKIGKNIFKPYSFREKPLEEEYETPNNVSIKRAVDLRKDFSAIRNQGKQGACSAFSLVSVFEYFLNRFKQPTDLSEAFVYYNARRINNKTNVDSGTTFLDIINAAKEDGICIEELCRYNENVFNETPFEEAYDDGESRKVTEAKNVSLDLYKFKSALSQGYPVVISARVFDSFVKNVNGFVKVPDESEFKGKEEYHAMVVCGYSDNEGYFIVRNSWGTNFGDSGYCYIPYEYMRNPRLISGAYVITGISSESVLSSDIDEGKSLIDERDFNAQKVINQNMLHEAQRLLSEERKELAEAKQDYLKLLNQIRTYGGLSDSDLRQVTDEERIKDILRKRQYVIYKGLVEINREYAGRSKNILDVSDFIKETESDIDKQNEIDGILFEKMKNSGLFSLDEIWRDLLSSMDIKSLFSDIKNTFQKVRNGKLGFYEVFYNYYDKIVEKILNKMDYKISDIMQTDYCKPFFENVKQSSIMAQVNGGLPEDYGDEIKYFICNLNGADSPFKEYNIHLLPIKDNLRMAFLHIEKYNIDDLELFNLHQES